MVNGCFIVDTLSFIAHSLLSWLIHYECHRNQDRVQFLRPYFESHVLQAGIVTLLALTGMLAFMLFVIAATVNAIVISSFISLAAVGVGLAIFFFCLTVIYIAMLFVAAFVTFTVTVSAIIAALFAAGMSFCHFCFIFAMLSNLIHLTHWIWSITRIKFFLG